MKNCDYRKKENALNAKRFQKLQRWSAIMFAVVVAIVIAMVAFMIYQIIARSLPAESEFSEFHLGDHTVTIATTAGLICVALAVVMICRIGKLRCKSCGHIHEMSIIVFGKPEYTDGCIRFRCPNCKENVWHEQVQKR